MPLQTTELLQPIAEANPGGEDIRYEPIFEQIKQARIDELELPMGDHTRPLKKADWPEVIKLSTEVLKKRSKDLQISVWLTEALLKREGFVGLRDGLELLAGLLRERWEHLYPEIEDGDVEFRAAPLEWLTHPTYFLPSIRQQPVTAGGMTITDYRDSRAVGFEADADDYEKREKRKAAIEAGKLTAEEFDASFQGTPKAWYKEQIAGIDGSSAALDALQKEADEKFGQDAPRFVPIKDAMLEVRQILAQLLARKLETDPDPIEETVEEADSVAVPAAVGAAGGGTAGGGTLAPVPQSLSDADARVAAAARYLRSTGPTDPAPYLMLRGYRWGELRVRGAEVDPKLLAAPPTEARTKLKGLLLDGKYQQLLESAEELMATPFGRGWLDLQRYVLSACEGLGAGYDYVSAGIRGALRALLRDIPQLPDLTLMDDSPTANAETRRWLQTQQLWGAGGEVEEPTAAPPPSLSAGARDGGGFDRLLDRLRNEPPQRAVEALLRDAAQQKSARARFMRRSQAARIMIDSGLDAVARPILEEMIQLIEKHNLEEWEEGETVAQPLGLLYRALGRLGDDGTRETLYLRVCRLDPIQAMHFAPDNDQAGE